MLQEDGALRQGRFTTSILLDLNYWSDSTHLRCVAERLKYHGGYSW
jgi:hypothetical protein